MVEHVVQHLVYMVKLALPVSLWIKDAVIDRRSGTAVLYYYIFVYVHEDQIGD